MASCFFLLPTLTSPRSPISHLFPILSLLPVRILPLAGIRGATSLPSSLNNSLSAHPPSHLSSPQHSSGSMRGSGEWDARAKVGLQGSGEVGMFSQSLLTSATSSAPIQSYADYLGGGAGGRGDGDLGGGAGTGGWSGGPGLRSSLNSYRSDATSTHTHAATACVSAHTQRSTPVLEFLEASALGVGWIFQGSNPSF